MSRHPLCSLWSEQFHEHHFKCNFLQEFKVSKTQKSQEEHVGATKIDIEEVDHWERQRCNGKLWLIGGLDL